MNFSTWASLARIPDGGAQFVPISEGADVRRAAPQFTLSDLRIDQAENLAGNQPIAGTVNCSQLQPPEGYLRLRLTYFAAGNRRSLYQRLEGGNPPAHGPISFAFATVNYGENKHTGPLILFLELCSYDDPKQRDTLNVVSNTVAVLVHVVAEK